MKTVVILSTDNLGMTVADMLNPREMKLVGMGDTRQETWNVFSDLEKGELKEEIEGMPIMPADLAVALQPDVLVIAATDSEKSHALEYMAIRAGFLNDIVFIRDLHEQFSIRCSVLRRLCRRLTGLGVEGNVAELGCYRGDTSWQLNVLMPDRKLYLFDTFEGFDERDVDMERKLGCSDAQTGLYSGTDKEKLMKYTGMLLRGEDSIIVSAIQALIITYEQLDDASKATLEKIATQYIENFKKSQ